MGGEIHLGESWGERRLKALWIGYGGVVHIYKMQGLLVCLQLLWSLFLMSYMVDVCKALCPLALFFNWHKKRTRGTLDRWA